MDAIGAGARVKSVAVGALIALVGACLACRAHLPLPWLLGPLLASAALHLAGGRAAPPTTLRNAGQLVVGAAVGLAFRPAVAALALSLWPLVLANAVATIALGGAGAWLLHRWTRLDLRTCYLSAAIGGASDMQALADRFGAEADAVGAAQVLRVVLVVLFVTMAMRWCVGDDGASAGDATASAFSATGFATLLAVAGAAGWVARRMDVPNAWGIAPLLASCACAASGLEPGAVPAAVLHTGQLAVGWSLGSRFAPGFFVTRPRFLVAVAVYTLGVLLAAALVAAVLGGLAGESFPSLVLGAAPGGVAEMSLTARTLDLDVALVASMQLTRIVAGAVVTAPLLALLQRRLQRDRERATSR